MIGVSRRGRLAAALTGPGIGATVIRESGDIDVHIVTHAAAGGRFALPRITGGALSVQRRRARLRGRARRRPAAVVAARARSAATSRSPPTCWRTSCSSSIVALVGGIWPALFAAVLSGLTLDFLFVAPLFTDHDRRPAARCSSLVLYVVIAILVSYIVDQAARRTRTAQRAAAESELLATVAGSVLRGESAVQALVSRTREAFGMRGRPAASPPTAPCSPPTASRCRTAA